MIITDDHVEWAVVDRLRRMLQADLNAEFNVTHSYALFTSILCWTRQRIGAGDSTEADRLAAGVLRRLEGQAVEEEPWRVPTKLARRLDDEQIGPFREFAGRNAADFVRDLRNAVAHGDHRTVRPFNRRAGSAVVLAGFTFDCNRKDRQSRKVVWRGTITLLETDMRRIGTGLADAFCKALRRSDEHRRDGNFERDAAMIQEAA